MIRSLRDFIDELKRRGELVEINEEVDWNYEIGCFDSLSGLSRGPALLFNKVKGVPEGKGRVVVNHLSGTFRKPHRRIAISLDIDPELDRLQYYDEIARRSGAMLRPVEVASGPCKEVIIMGNDVNLLEYPFLYHAIGDGGRYILLGHTTIKDPDSDWINMGNYCVEVYSRNRLVLTPYGYTNFVQIYTLKYEPRNQSMPVAVVLGTDPAVTLSAVTILPPGVSELDAAGGIRGVPVELVRCETSDLLVPANSEMIIEGEVRPYERLPEGPKTESFGFSTGPRQPFYAMRVHCITHRHNPIIPETHQTRGSIAYSLLDGLWSLSWGFPETMAGIPVKGVYASTFTVGNTLYHAIRKLPYPGFTQDILNKIRGIPPGMDKLRLGVVDDDVNITEPGALFEAEYTQTNPARDIFLTGERQPVSTLACSWMEEEDVAKIKGGTIPAPTTFFDATTKEEPPLGVRRTQFETVIPDEMQKWVVDNWKRLGLTEEPRWQKAWIEHRGLYGGL